MHLNADQYEALMRPLNTRRVAKRQQGGKSLSYLEAWDVKAHLTRVFGFGNWDAEVVSDQLIAENNYERNDKPMVEVIWKVTMRLTIRTTGRHGEQEVTRYCEGAVGSATGGLGGAGVGDLHDNAYKSAASDALKRCAINLGTQFGLSLYDDGSTREVVGRTLVGVPDGWVDPKKEAAAVGAQVFSGGNPSATEEPA